MKESIQYSHRKFHWKRNPRRFLAIALPTNFWAVAAKDRFFCIVSRLSDGRWRWTVQIELDSDGGEFSIGSMVIGTGCSGESKTLNKAKRNAAKEVRRCVAVINDGVISYDEKIAHIAFEPYKGNF